MAESVIELRNDGATALLRAGTVSDLAPLQDLPDVRHVWLAEIRVTSDVLRFVARLPQIAAVSIANAKLSRVQFAILDGLPPGTAVKVYDQDHNSPAWNEFRRRRANRVARLPADRRQEAAERYAQGIALIGDRPYDGGRTVEISHGDAADEDIRHLRWLPHMETLNFGRCWGVTTAALTHLAGHPTLRTLDLNGLKITAPLKPLARCPALEDLELFPDEGLEPKDDDLAGLEKMTGLRRFKCWTGGFGDRTLARIGRLAHLRQLSVPFGELAGDESLRHLSGLCELEMLLLGTPTPLSGECLRHLAGLTRLRALHLYLEAGDGDGLRHLAGLSSLEFLTLFGNGVTDAGVRHLHGLTCLRVVQFPTSKVSAKAATALANALPHVAVHLTKSLVKSPRPVVSFSRRSAGGFVSALIPTHWTERSARDKQSIVWTEDGFEQYDRDWSFYGQDVRAATVRLWVQDNPEEKKAADYLRACAKEWGRMPKRFETGVVKVKSGGDSAAAAFPRNGESCLTGVAMQAGRAGAVQCEAAPKRYAAFQGLFKFIAGSIQVGPSASRDEKVDVPVGELV
ncbi:leucine-rich repeat domain-containing protein [Limnoglobus roseus]|nr:hypothetical protein [Limnoglobus roseus]